MKVGVYSFLEGKEPKDLIEEIKRLKYDVGNFGYKIKNQRHEINNRLKENQKLKELLKECKQRFETYKRVKPCGEYMIYDLDYLANKINEVLK